MSGTSLSTAVSIEDKALELLGMGFEQVQVASALQVSESRISQLVSDERFALRLSEAKYKALIKHNETDNILDKIEKKLAEKLDSLIPLMMRPGEVTNALSRVNSMKRRGVSSPESVTRAKPVVKLQIPIAVVNHFQMNAAGQVISVGDDSGTQDLVTIQSGSMKALVNEHSAQLKTEAEVRRFESGRKVLPSRITNRQGPEHETGQRYIKPQGRACEDILDECGFSIELTIDSPPAD